jgi:hypothetical protein
LKASVVNRALDTPNERSTPIGTGAQNRDGRAAVVGKRGVMPLGQTPTEVTVCAAYKAVPFCNNDGLNMPTGATTPIDEWTYANLVRRLLSPSRVHVRS